jgi:hypothetical protein
MSEPIEQSGVGGREQEQSQEYPSLLGDRLLSRLTKPIGLINTHHPQQIQARTAGWAAQRFEMLDRWRTRYIGDENEAALGGQSVSEFAPLALQRPALGESVPSASGIRHIAHTPAPESSGLPKPSIQTSPAAPMMRVMRRAKPVQAATSETGAPRTVTSTAIVPTNVDRQKTIMMNDDRTAGGSGLAESRQPLPSRPTAAPARPSSSGIRGVEPQSPSGAAQPAIRSPRKSDQATEQRTQRTSPITSRPLAAPAIQRKAILGESGQSHSQRREDATGHPSRGRASQIAGRSATTAEIPFASFTVAQPQLILRKAGSGESAGPRETANAGVTPAAPTIARQETAGSSSSAAAAAPGMPPSRPKRRAVDIDKLAERVSRILERRLETERDRRGR